MKTTEKVVLIFITIASFLIIFSVLWTNRIKFVDGTMVDGMPQFMYTSEPEENIEYPYSD